MKNAKKWLLISIGSIRLICTYEIEAADWSAFDFYVP